jgi:hypothetical protein
LPLEKSFAATKLYKKNDTNKFFGEKEQIFLRKGNYMMTKGISPYTPRDFMLQGLKLMFQGLVQ